jgi:glycosyltransferase involved in cell wall biosynthesis
MRILLVSGSLPPMKCGVGDYTAQLAKAIVRCENMSVAVLTDAAATPIPSDFEFEVFPLAHSWRMADIAPIASMVRRWRPDIVDIQYPTQGYGSGYFPWLLPALFRIANIPVVQTWHEYHPETMGRRNLLNAMLGGGLIAVRPDYKRMMSALYRWLIRRKQFRFIPGASAIPTIRLSDAERSALRLRVTSTSNRLVVFFGFAHAAKRIELLFEIADPERDRLALICDLNSADAYQESILKSINRAPWAGKANVTGFLPSDEVARILAAADAVVLPFQNGGGLWNTSIRAATAQGTFVLTTSCERHGYDSSENVYYARPEDVPEMREALRTFIGNRNSETVKDPCSEWDSIASEHVSLFKAVAAEYSGQ